jgi:AmmeMemoRadiSam system protein B/AmmeMemoRadiSam system protein A
MAALHISPYAGTWYPDRVSDLERLLEERFEESARRTGQFLFRDALGYVTPHAGPAYSGTVAAAVYRTVRQQPPERIVFLAFPHHGGLEGVALPNVDAISTPLGETAIDLSWGEGFPRVNEGWLCDHSFEIQLPFLQMSAPLARVTPLYVGRMNSEERRAIADQLASKWQAGVVFIASSDFTHYGPSFHYVPFPPDRSVGRRLRELDHECIEACSGLDPALFSETLRDTGATVCGTGPIGLLLDVLARLGGDGVFQTTLDYQTSGEITDDYRNSVSYAALGYFPRSAFDLDAEDREALLDSAEATLQRLRDTGERERVLPRKGSAALDARRGAFVSLHQGEELLGCVGNCTGRAPLAQDVPDLALAAALEDPRFRPAASAQGPIDVEISVLTPFRRIRGAEQFCLGRHGACLALGRHSGLLLPQVGREFEWTVEEFFGALSRKSSLGPRAWRDPKARLYAFEAQVFARKG